MKAKHLLPFAMLISFFSLHSCSKKDDPDPPAANKRIVTYEITGNFSGTAIASYTTASGGTTNENITIPWNKAITYVNTVDAAILAISGNGGTAGQTVTAVIKQNGIPTSATPATASGSTGSFSKSCPVITF